MKDELKSFVKKYLFVEDEFNKDFDKWIELAVLWVGEPDDLPNKVHTDLVVFLFKFRKQLLATTVIDSVEKIIKETNGEKFFNQVEKWIEFLVLYTDKKFEGSEGFWGLLHFLYRLKIICFNLSDTQNLNPLYELPQA